MIKDPENLEAGTIIVHRYGRTATLRSLGETTNSPMGLRWRSQWEDDVDINSWYATSSDGGVLHVRFAEIQKDWLVYSEAIADIFFMKDNTPDFS